MAQRNVAQNGCAEGPNHSGATGQGPKRRGASVSSSCRHDRRPRWPVEAKRLLAEMTAIADTGFSVAFANRNDHYHAWAAVGTRRRTGPHLPSGAIPAPT